MALTPADEAPKDLNGGDSLSAGMKTPPTSGRRSEAISAISLAGVIGTRKRPTPSGNRAVHHRFIPLHQQAHAPPPRSQTGPRSRFAPGSTISPVMLRAYPRPTCARAR